MLYTSVHHTKGRPFFWATIFGSEDFLGISHCCIGIIRGQIVVVKMVAQLGCDVVGDRPKCSYDFFAPAFLKALATLALPNPDM